MTFTVYVELAPEVSKKLDRLAKKAEGYAIPFAYSMGEEHPQTVAVREVDPVTQTIQTVSTYTVAAVDFEVERDKDAAISAAWKEDEDKRAYWKLERDRIGTLERNCITLALGGYAKVQQFGLLAYMPVAYERHQERMARKAAQEAAGAWSVFVGDVGQRITLKAATVALLSSWDGYYGTTWLYKFVDESGNVYIWYASRPCTAEDGATIKATVKDHNERDGVKQTIVTRCCIAT